MNVMYGCLDGTKNYSHLRDLARVLGLPYNWVTPDTLIFTQLSSIPGNTRRITFDVRDNVVKKIFSRYRFEVYEFFRSSYSSWPECCDIASEDIICVSWEYFKHLFNIYYITGVYGEGGPYHCWMLLQAKSDGARYIVDYTSCQFSRLDPNKSYLENLSKKGVLTEEDKYPPCCLCEYDSWYKAYTACNIYAISV